VGRELANGPLVMQGRFVEAARELEGGLIADSLGGPSRHRDTQRVWLAHLYWLMDQPGLAHLRASETAPDAVPINLPFLGAPAGIAFLVKDLQLLGRIRDRAAQIAARWPSTFSDGTRALCDALLAWAAGDARAGDSFTQAHGLWPDPLTLYWLARWQSHQRDFAGALATLGEMEAAEGTLLRYHFVGLSVLGWIEAARCLRSLSRFPESLRYYRRVLDGWEAHAGAFGIVRQVHDEYHALEQGANKP